jgi:hypothetical protein
MSAMASTRRARDTAVGAPHHAGYAVLVLRTTDDLEHVERLRGLIRVAIHLLYV